MTTQTENETELGCCGLDCGICAHRWSDCPGCAAGGGDPDCEQRRCCAEKGIAGCWQCDRFPCARGYFTDEAWRGLAVGCCTVAAAFGPDELRHCMERLGDSVDYGAYRHQRARDFVRMLYGGSHAA